MPDTTLHKTTLNCGAVLYYKGLPFEMGPLPAFFYFSLSGPDSLCLEPFNQPATSLEGDELRVFSISLPFHDDYDKRKVVSVWARELQKGNDIITPFVVSAQKAIDELIDRDIIDPENCAVGGLSRGSFIAAHLAAIEPRIKAIVGFAPLVSLTVSTSFKECQNAPMLEKLSLFHLKDSLKNTALRFYIGNRDTMVQTSVAYEFIRKLTDHIYDSGVRSPRVELIISPSIGHKGHGTPKEKFQDGADWIKTQLGLIS